MGTPYTSVALGTAAVGAVAGGLGLAARFAFNAFKAFPAEAIEAGTLGGFDSLIGVVGAAVGIAEAGTLGLVIGAAAGGVALGAVAVVGIVALQALTDDAHPACSPAR
jgi:hypothetical protein